MWAVLSVHAFRGMTVEFFYPVEFHQSEQSLPFVALGMSAYEVHYVELHVCYLAMVALVKVPRYIRFPYFLLYSSCVLLYSPCYGPSVLATLCILHFLHCIKYIRFELSHVTLVLLCYDMALSLHRSSPALLFFSKKSFSDSLPTPPPSFWLPPSGHRAAQ